MRRVFILCSIICAALLAHLAFDALRLYRSALSQTSTGYQLVEHRLTDRVVLIVIDSWPLRILEAPEWMPRLRGRLSQGASGVLWAPMQTGTIQGVLTLATGTPPSGLAAIGLMSSARYAGWTVYDDVAARGENVLFAGGPAWVTLFGDRGHGHGPENGHGPEYRNDDMRALALLEQALLSAEPPALSVLHISETDFVAHQAGTSGPVYAELMHHWDEALDQMLTRVLVPGTTVIVTADHGNDGHGSHGGSDPIFRRVPVVMLGTAVEPGAMIEMNAADMPATIATMLGVRAPENVPALPAVEAMSLSPSERERILETAYRRTVLGSPRVQADAGLRARAQAAVDAAASGRAGGGAEYRPELRAALADLEPDLAPVRAWDPADWVFALLTFAAAWLLWWVSTDRRAATGGAVARRPVTWAIAFVAAETAFIIRWSMAGPIKLALRNRDPRLIGVLLALALAVAIAGWRYWPRRARVFAWLRANVLPCAALLYLLSTALRPVTALGLGGIAMVGAFAYSSKWPVRIRLGVAAAFGLYLVLGGYVLWPMMGESMITRYLVGAPIAAFGMLALALLERRYGALDASVRRVTLVGAGLLLVLFPAGGLGIAGWSSANFVWLATALLLAFCGGVALIARPPWWAWFGPVAVAAFWWFPSFAGFTILLSACALLALLALLRHTTWRSHRIALFVLLASMLMLLTTPTKALSVFVLLGAVLAFLVWEPGHEQRADALVFAALFVLACRYALFDLFGNTDDTIFFGLQNIDVGSAYVGDATRAIVPAVLMALFKVWLAGAVLLAALPLFEHWRDWTGQVAGLAGVFLLLNVGQASVYAALAVGERTYLYDGAAFSVFVNTAMFVFAVLAFAGLETVRRGASRPVGASS